MRLLAISVLLSFVLTNCPTQGDTELVSMTASVSPSEAGTVNPPNGTYTSGQQISVETESADERWEFIGWTGDTTASADSLSFGIARNMDLVANYEIPTEQRPILITAAEPREGGSVTPDSSSYALGETVEVLATADEGWQFLSWSGDTTVSTNPLSVTMNNDYQLTAQFEQVEPDEFMLATSANPTEGGSIEPADGSFVSGSTVSVQVQPSEGWLFDGWSGDTTASSNPLELIMDKNYELTASFSKQIVNLSTGVDPSEGGAVSPESGSYEYGSSVEVSATPAEGWQFVSWAGDTTISVNPVTVSVDKDYTLTAVFEKKSYQLTTAASPADGGSVSPTSDSYSYGTAVDVEATAASGWAFTGWSGDTTTTDNPISIVVDKDYNVTANFRELAQPFVNRITVSDGQSSKEVVFGMDPNATSGFDAGLDQELPPRPPEGNFYRRFNIADRGLKDDYRGVRDQRTVWELEFAPQEGRSIMLSWDFSTTDHVGSLMLVDDPDNPSVKIDMKSQTQYDVTDQSMNMLYIISKN